MDNLRYQLSFFYFLLFLLSVSAVIIVYFLPFSEYAYIRLDHIVWLFIFLVAIFKGTLLSNKLIKYPSVKPLILFCLVCLFSTLSIFATKIVKLNVYNSLWYQIAMYQCAIIYIIALTSFPIVKRETFIKCVIFLGVVLSIIGLMQFLYIVPPYAYNIRMGIPDNRATGLLSFNSLHLATYLVTSIFLGYGIFMQQRSFIKKILVLCGLLLMITVLILTKSRSAWLGFLMGNIIFAFVTFRMTKGKSFFIMIIMFVVLLVNIYYMANVQEVVSEAVEKRDSSAYSRLLTYDLFFKYVQNHPLILVTGVGFMNWRYSLGRDTEASSAHNLYLNITGELGIGGLLLFLWFWYRNFKMAKYLAREGDLWGRMLIPIIGAYLVTCLTGEILYPVWSLENLLFFIMLVSGVVLSAHNPGNLSFPVEKAIS